MSVSSKDFTDLSNNLQILATAITVQSVNVLAKSLVQTLAAAQPRVPIDTGELRESGNARIMIDGRRGIVIARGTASGTVNVMLDKITAKRVKGAKKIDAVIEYKRTRADFDVAVFTHEYIGPYGSGSSPQARTPGTGPKYLELAWNETKSNFMTNLKSIISNSNLEKTVRKLTGSTKKTKGRYTVDQRVMVWNRIDSLGYYK